MKTKLSLKKQTVEILNRQGDSFGGQGSDKIACQVQTQPLNNCPIITAGSCPITPDTFWDRCWVKPETVDDLSCKICVATRLTNCGDDSVKYCLFTKGC